LCIAKQWRAKILEVGSLFHKNYFSTYWQKERGGPRRTKWGGALVAKQLQEGKDKARGNCVFSHAFATLDRIRGLPAQQKWQKCKHLATLVADM
jgi:hypothetical protein